MHSAVSVRQVSHPRSSMTVARTQLHHQRNIHLFEDVVEPAFCLHIGVEVWCYQVQLLGCREDQIQQRTAHGVETLTASTAYTFKATMAGRLQ